MNALDLVRYGDHTAIITEQGEKLSYSQLNERIEQFIHASLSFSPKIKRLFLMRAEASLAFVIAYSACLKTGHALMLISPNAPEEWSEALQNDFQVNCVLKCHGDTAQVDMLHENNLDIHPELALLLPTSGSTGSPKYVRLSYRNLYSNAQAISSYLALSENEIAITSLPLSYSYGLSILNSHFLVGACLVLTNASIMERRFWDLMSEWKVTGFAGVPYSYTMLKRLRFETKELPELRYMTQAGGKLSEADINYFSALLNKQGKQFFVMYGQTEATARMAYLPPEKLLTKAGSIGIAIPGGRFELKGDNDVRITDIDTVGELVYYGENVMMGYAFSYRELSKPAQLNSLKTGDLASRDADGFFYIVGRKNRFIKLLGNRVDLDRVEEWLNQQDLSVACVGTDETLHIFLTHLNDLDRVKMSLHQAMSIPPSVVIGHQLDPLPRTENGKMHYAVLMALAGLK